jgi:SAM-dependent methyltransferase
MATMTRTLSRPYAKLCDRRDFDDPAVRARIREIVPGLEPDAELHRKYWEFAMLTLFLEDVGKLDDSAEALAVGAGHETVLFWLANRMGRVVAIDIYGEGPFAGREADSTMLDDPGRFAPYPYRTDRLEVRHMDARKLDFPDESFDVVFSLSSIEHFGRPDGVVEASREIGRVLRPGGVAFIATECYLRRHPLDVPLVQTAIRRLTGGRLFATANRARRTDEIFTREEIRRQIVAPSGLELVEPVRYELSEETFENLIHWRRGGTLEPRTGQAHPHLVLKAHGSPWTSIALPLSKPN